MIEILGLITFTGAAAQDLKEQQVNLILLAPFYLASLTVINIGLFALTTLLLSGYFIARQKYSLNTGLGTADLLLTVPTILIFAQLDALLVIIILYSAPITYSIIYQKKRVPAIPGMALGYAALLIISLI